MKRYLPWIVAVVVCIATVGLWFASQVRDEVAAVADLAENLDVDVALNKVELSQGSEGKAAWRLVANGADYLKDQELVRLDRPRVIYYQEQDGAEVEVTASEGEVDQASGDARLWPDVVIVSGPTTVYAERLHYKGESRDIDLTGEVRMERGEMRLNAPHMVMNMKTNDITADGGVTSLLWSKRPATPAKERQQ